MDMSPLRVLFLAANPTDLAPVALDEEVRAIEHKLRRARYRDSVELITRWAVRPGDLQDALLETEPHIVHFSGHAGNPGIYLVDDEGQAQAVTGKALAMMLEAAGQSVRIVVFNACYTDALAREVVWPMPGSPPGPVMDRRTDGAKFLSFANQKLRNFAPSPVVLF